MNNKCIKTIRFLFSHTNIFRVNYFLCTLFQTISSIIQPLLTVYCIPMVISTYTLYRTCFDQSLHRLIIVYILIMIAGTFISKIVYVICLNQRKKVEQSFTLFYKQNLLKASMEMEYEKLESFEILETMNLAKEGISPEYSNGLHGLTDNCIDIVNASIVSLTTIITVGLLDSVLLIPITITAILTFFLQRQINKVEYSFYENLSEINRKFGYITKSISEYTEMKDIKLFQAEEFILKKEKDYLQIQCEYLKDLKNKIKPYRLTSGLVFCIQNIFIFLFSFYRLYNYSINIALFIEIVNASILCSDSLSSLMKAISDLVLNCEYASDYVTFFSTFGLNEEPYAVTTSYRKDSLLREIKFIDVSFSYPNTEKKVLDKINLIIKAGETLSIVGRNGQGKTTLIKLLCKLYDSYEGSILYGDIDIKNIPNKEWYNILTAVFQDFSLLPYTVRENVFNNSELIENSQLINSLLTDKIPTDATISRLLNENGRDFSGGEEQKIALARAINRNCPIMILDEPTASLDAKTESELYKLFFSLTKGNTVLFISHRLASCQFCNRIIVLNEGKIVEQGTHNDLIKTESGIYSQMWKEQSSLYS